MMILYNNLFCGSCDAQSKTSAYVSVDRNKPFIDNMVNIKLKDNIFGTKGIISLIFDTGDSIF